MFAVLKFKRFFIIVFCNALEYCLHCVVFSAVSKNDVIGPPRKHFAPGPAISLGGPV